jgi:hypothetical protein
LSKFIGKNQPDLIPLSAQPIAFWELLEKGSIPKECLLREYTAQQFVERLVHYVLSVPNKSFSMAQLSRLLEQLDPRLQIFFFKRLKETSPQPQRICTSLLWFYGRISSSFIHINHPRSLASSPLSVEK